MKRIPKRYGGTVFDRAQIEKLKILLDFESDEKVVLFALLITTRYCDYLYKTEVRRRISSVKNSKRELESIAKKSKELARMLEEHPISQKLVRRRAESLEQWLAEVQDEDGIIHMGRLQEEDRKKLELLVEALKVVSDAAWFFLDNDDQFREAVHLPRAEDAEKTAVRAHFWPGLFVIWEEAGKSVAGGEGPLHKFVTLVHEACNLGNVSASTLGAAAAEWNRRKAQVEAEFEQRFGRQDTAEDFP